MIYDRIFGVQNARVGRIKDSDNFILGKHLVIIQQGYNSSLSFKIKNICF